MGEEARHHDTLAEVAQPRLRPLAVGERDRQLGIAAACRGRQREAASEARVDVGDLVAPVRLTKALDVGRASQRQRLRDAAAELDQLVVLDRLPLDRLAALRLDHRARDRVQAAGLEIAEDVDRELLAEAELLDERIDRRVAQEELELGRIVRTVDVARAEPLPHLDE